MTDDEIKSMLEVKIAAVSSVCEYLHGATGVVIHPFASTDVVANGTGFKRVAIHRVRLHEPRKPTENWTPIEVIGLRAEQLRRA